MRRKALLVVLCWLTLSKASDETNKVAKNTVAIDNESAESAPKLYQNNQFSLYASGSPYGAFTFQQPTFISAPKAAGTQLVPIKQHGFVIQNSKGFLKDSYGNKFVETPQSVAYKTTFPQQFVQLQDLPSHLSQPLVATASNFRNIPQYSFGSSPFQPQAIQATPTPITYFSGHTKPLVYAESIKSFAPSFGLHTHLRLGNQQQANAQQQPTINNAVFANTHSVEVFKNVKNGPKFQRLGGPDVHVIQETRDGPTHQSLKHEQEQGSPAQLTKVIANNNGEKTVTLIETNPPLPLLDLSLLEPLTFDNPIVPQVQHFLPKIHQVTYTKLPEATFKEAKRHQNEIIVQNTRSYDSGIIKPKNESPIEEEKRPPVDDDDDDDDDTQVHPKPNVIITGNPDGNEFSYEINSPNRKEIYNEQVIKYNKETQKEPVTYDYNHKTESKPVHYSFVRNSKDPEQIREVHFTNGGQSPKQLIYNFKPEQRDEDESSHGHPVPQREHESSEASRESSAESDEEGPSYQDEQIEYQKEAPRPSQNLKAEHREEEYHHEPNHKEVPRHSNNHQEGYKHDPKVQNHEVIHPPSSQHHSQPIKTSQHNVQTHFQPIITHEYEEDIRLIPAYPSNAPLKVDPGQHIIHKHQNQHPTSAPRTHPQQQSDDPRIQPQQQSDDPPEHHPRQHPPNAHVHEKSKQIIIQEESPDEMHSLREQMMAEVVNQEENNEEDFEKAYKDAAFGFPGYEEKESEETEKDIYSPESYGVPRYQNEYSIENSPFQEYQKEGDEYPKSSRLNYKDIRDKKKQDYYKEYEVRKPESLTDLYSKKEDYYKMYMKHRPEKYFAKDNDEKSKQKAKYTAVPNYEYFAESKPKPKNQLAHYRTAPRHRYEYDYSKGNPRDSSAHASRPYQRYKIKTNFVEPQFQYGFEPVSLPRLLDSELATMASNNSPESEKPGTRKKLYKENWYIKKTSTSALKPAS